MEGMNGLQSEAIVSAMAGGALCVVIARYAIMRAFSDLQKISDQITAISTKLSIVELKLGQLEKLEEKSFLLSNQITDIQSRLKYERA